MLLLGALGLLGAQRAAVAADEELELGGGAVLGDHHQVVFVARRGNARHGAYLAVAELTAREGFVDLRQAWQRTGDAHPFASGPQGDAALPVEPMGGALEAKAQVAVSPIEAFEQQKEPVFGGIEVPRQLRQRVLERFEVFWNVGLRASTGLAWFDGSVEHTPQYCLLVQLQASNLT